MSTWFILDESTLKVSGNSSYNTPQIQGNKIVIYINKLSPGQYLTISYKVTISSVIAPGVSITTTATTTSPYSQVYYDNAINFQYANLNKTASVNIVSLGINFVKTNISNLLKIGSLITYIITATIPKGTITYGLYIKDILPSGAQTYVGPSYKNGIIVNPLVSSNVITFPTVGTVDARLQAQTIEYIMTCKISTANKILNTITSNQTNSAQCLYQQIQSGSFATITKTLALTINHPNLFMNLSATDKTTLVIYNQTANINTNAIIQFKFNFQNNSDVKLINGTIEIPIDDNFLFSSIDTMVFCSATYNISNKNLIIIIPQLDAYVSGFVTFTLIPRSNLRVGTSINTQAIAISYYNDISSTKIYSGEKSNILTCVLHPGVSLIPNPLFQINDSTAFIVTQPGNIAVIIDYFKNTGGGYDDFTLTIQKVNLEYSLYIDDVKIADVPANVIYSATLPQTTNLAPDTNKIIIIIAHIPIDQPLGIRYNFTVTIKSNTIPYPKKTVLNIDPN